MASRRSVRTVGLALPLSAFLSVSLGVPALTRSASASTASVPAASASAGDADLAYRWAPIHYQDTSSAYYSADYGRGGPQGRR